MEKTRVKLRICDIDCTITSDDNEEYVRTLGGEIDRAISSVLEKNDRISLSMAAIITAMTYCDESAKAKAELAELKSLDKSRETQYHQLKQAALDAEADAARLRLELQTLQSFLTPNKDLFRLRNALQSAQATQAPANDEEMVFRCINGKPTYVPASSVEEAHTLEELYDSIETVVAEPSAENLLGELPQALKIPEQASSKQNAGPQEQSEQALLKKEGFRSIRTYSSLQKNVTPLPEVATGRYTRPKAPFEPKLPSDDAFISFFEKK